MNEEKFASYVWIFWFIVGLGVIVYGLITMPLYMIGFAAIIYAAYRLLGGE